jgi:hypothetical protein
VRSVNLAKRYSCCDESGGSRAQRSHFHSNCAPWYLDSQLDRIVLLLPLMIFISVFRIFFVAGVDTEYGLTDSALNVVSGTFLLKVCLACVIGDHPALNDMGYLTPCTGKGGCRCCSQMAQWVKNKVAWKAGVAGRQRDLDKMRKDAESAENMRLVLQKIEQVPKEERSGQQKTTFSKTSKLYAEHKRKTGVMGLSVLWRLDELYQTKGTRFNMALDLVPDGMHLSKNVLKDVMAGLKSKFFKGDELEVMNSRIASIKFLPGTTANRPYHPSTSSSWSTSAVCNFWTELAPVIYDGLLDEECQAEATVKETHLLFRSLLHYQFPRSKLQELRDRIKHLHQDLFLRDFGPSFFDLTLHMMVHIPTYLERHSTWPCTWVWAMERKNHCYIKMFTNGTAIEWQFAAEECRRVALIDYLDLYEKYNMVGRAERRLLKVPVRSSVCGSKTSYDILGIPSPEGKGKIHLSFGFKIAGKPSSDPRFEELFVKRYELLLASMTRDTFANSEMLIIPRIVNVGRKASVKNLTLTIRSACQKKGNFFEGDWVRFRLPWIQDCCYGIVRCLLSIVLGGVEYNICLVSRYEVVEGKFPVELKLYRDNCVFIELEQIIDIFYCAPDFSLDWTGWVQLAPDNKKFWMVPRHHVEYFFDER